MMLVPHRAEHLAVKSAFPERRLAYDYGAVVAELIQLWATALPSEAGITCC
jgi:hypothetical protein